MALLSVRDETTAGETLAELELQFDAEAVTVAEVIRARVHQEVRLHNTGHVRSPFRGLVRPVWDELSGAAERGWQSVDAEAQTVVALQAFERGQVLLLVNDRQVTDPEATVTLAQGSTVSFLKLVPLVGG